MKNEQPTRGIWLTAGHQKPIVPFPGVEIWTASSDNVMLALVTLAPGAVIPAHAHENEQTGGVISGVLTFTIADETRDVIPGQGYVIPANTTHAAVAGAGGCQVFEVFVPPREGYRMLPEDRT